MPNRPSSADALADFKRNFRWSIAAPSLAWPVIYFIAMNRLGHTGPESAVHLAWYLLPLPFFIWGYLAWTRFDTTTDEVARRIEQHSSTVAYRISIFLAAVVGLTAAAWGWPIAIHLGSHLPPLIIDWQGVLVILLLIKALAGIRETARIFPKS